MTWIAFSSSFQQAKHEYVVPKSMPITFLEVVVVMVFAGVEYSKIQWPAGRGDCSQ
jgi:hypothetical protein